MLKSSKNSDVAVLFVNIGWAQRYDGTEIIIGGHKYLKDNPENIYNLFFLNRILLRNLENIRGLNNKYFRISVNTKENINCFLNTLNAFMQHEL